MQQNLDRFKFRFYHFEDKKIYDVITFQKLPTEEFIRCFLTRPLPNGISIDDIEEQLKIEERVEQKLILNHKSNIDGELMQSTGLKDKNGKLVFEKMLINNHYIVDFQRNSYILINILTNDIVLLYEYAKQNSIEITKEYCEL